MFGNSNNSNSFSMIGPMGHAARVTGLPVAATPMAKAPKVTTPNLNTASKPTRRGRKPSGKPGATHLAALQQAHGAGNFKAAKTHALNYANAVHTHATNPMSAGGAPATSVSAAGPATAPPTEPDQDDMGGSTETTGGHWIAGAIKHPGALHRELGVPQGQTIPAAKVAKAAHSSNPTLAKRARLAETLKRMKK